MSIANIEAEQAVISIMMTNSQIVDSITEILCADDFSQLDNKRIFTQVIEMVNRKIPVDAITILNEFDANGIIVSPAYIVELINGCMGSANAIVYAKIVKESARKRGLQAVLEIAGRALHDDKTSSSDDLIARTASLVGGLQCADGEGIRNTKQILKSLSRTWDRRSQMNGEIDGLKTGLLTLDERFQGWKPGDLIIIAGRPSMGKSIMAFQVVLNAAVREGKRCMVFSLEMTAEQLLERGTAAIGNIDLDVLRRCEKESFGRFSHEITSAATILANSDILIDDTPQLHINQIMARARNAHRKKPLSIVMVDHISIVRADGQNREREVAQISGSLKALAKELGCPVIGVIQLNRNVEAKANKRPMMSDLRDSGAVEQDADIVILLYRDEYYNDDSPDKGIIEIITSKFREGETGIDRCESLLHQSRIKDLTYEYKAPIAPQKKHYAKGLD